MTIDPYLYPDSNTLQNRLGLRDSGAVDAVISDAFDRGAALIRNHPAVTTAQAFKALHNRLFAEVFEWAGQSRTANLYLGSARYARVDIIDAALEHCFAELEKADCFAGQPLAHFCEQLAAHISTLNAIAPFRIGNRRILHLHAAHIAKQAGHAQTWPQFSQAAWARLLDDNFLSLANDDLVNAFAGQFTSDEILCDPRAGIGGIALLPLRDPPAGKRYLVSLKKAKTMVAQHLRAAQGEATKRIRALLASGASHTALLSARQELRYMFHPKGALFQLELLEALSSGKIRALLSDEQGPLEIVREVAAAVSIEMNAYPRGRIETLCNQLYTPPVRAGVSPHDERMAREFLTNLSAQNRVDPRFAEAQRMVDALVLAETMASGVEGDHMAEAVTNARATVAERIRTGAIDLLPNADAAFDAALFAEAKQA
jgi:cell filamentation protein